jgi:phospholipid/cholesterol/gamma-HCH transport system substrate-binding protein
MQSVRTKFSVGLFVIIGMSAVILAVLWLGMSEYFREGRNYVSYFDESVQGLSQDAAVKYRGVSVGRVKQISVAPDGRLIEIVFTVDKTLQDTGNLVAQIKSVGITGIMFMELERQSPEGLVAIPNYAFDPKHPVIATRPSEIKQLLSDLYEILSRIRQVDVEGISAQFSKLLKSTNQILADARIDELSTGLQQLIENGNQLLDEEKWSSLRRSADDAVANINELIADTKKTVNQLDATITASAGRFDNAVDEVGAAARNADSVFTDGSQSLQAAGDRARAFDRRLVEIMDELRETASGLNRLLDQLQRKPSRMFYGPPPPAKPVEPETGG